MQKIVSWNINGVRACLKKGMVGWIKKEKAHVLCFQEMKIQEKQLDVCLPELPHYTRYLDLGTRPGYSGVATYVHQDWGVPLNVETGLGLEEFDREGRTLITEFPEFILYNCYFPNGGRDCSRVEFKLDYCHHLAQHALQLKKAKKKEVIVCGDYNTAHKEMDLKNPKANLKTSGFLPQERAFLDEFVAMGFHDSFRVLHPNRTDDYTWWTYRNNCRERNIGWRIDYFFVTSGLVKKIKKCDHRHHVQGSDHCPVVLELD